MWIILCKCWTINIAQEGSEKKTLNTQSKLVRPTSANGSVGQSFAQGDLNSYDISGLEAQEMTWLLLNLREGRL